MGLLGTPFPVTLRSSQDERCIRSTLFSGLFRMAWYRCLGLLTFPFFLALLMVPYFLRGWASAFARRLFCPPIGLPFCGFDGPGNCPFCHLVAFSYLELWLYLVGFGLGKFMRTQSLVCIFLMKCCTPWPGFLSLARSFLSHSLPPWGLAFRSLIETFGVSFMPAFLTF